MGAPKQKWTAEEEAALRAGIVKHGAGKWRTILKDPEFSSILYLRSNVDLKDKWRNMNVMVSGWGSSREKCRTPFRRTYVPEQEESSMSAGAAVPSDEETEDVQPVAVPAQKRTTVRLENLIMEALTTLKEPGGSNKSSIAAYIEDEYWAPADFKRLLSTKLRFMTATGKLIKVKRKYIIAPASGYYERRRNSSISLLDERRNVFPRVDRDDFNILTREQVDIDLAKMVNMSPEEAAAFAARAVSEAEAAIAEAEEAEKEAEAAEADAEAAQAFAEAANKTLRGSQRNPANVMIRA